MRKVASSICRRFQYNMLRKIAEEDSYELMNGGRITPGLGESDEDDILDEETLANTRRVYENPAAPMSARQLAKMNLDRHERAVQRGINPSGGGRHINYGDSLLNPPQQVASNPPQMSPEEAFGPRPSYVEHAPYNPQQLAQAQASAPPQAPAPSVPPARPDMKSIAPSFAQKTTADRPGADFRKPGVAEAVPGSTNGGSGVWSKIRGAVQRGAEYAVNPGAAVRDIGRVGTAVGKKILNAAGDGAYLGNMNSFNRINGR